jgi:uncharacterized protein (DUF169 family)
MSRDLAERLSSSLKLAQPPVAISFTDSKPAGLAPAQQNAPAGCRFWQDGAQSTFVTESRDHELCAIGVHTHHLDPTPAQQKDMMDALKVFADLTYVRPEDVAGIPVLESSHRYVVYGPLAEAHAAPDVVILFVDAGQSLVLSEAAQQVENQNAPAMGRPACAVVPQVVNSGRAALSLGCCGARAYLDVFRDDISIFAIPGAKLEEYVERIEALSGANRLLSQFHALRRASVAAGARPSIQESLESMSS